MTKNIPLNKITGLTETGIFVKHRDDWESGTVPDSVHRDDYYIFAVLLDGTAGVMVDFSHIPLKGGEGIIVSPGQVHRPFPNQYLPDVWSLFISRELIAEWSSEKIARYSLATSPLQFTSDILDDISSLFEILSRNIRDAYLSRNISLAIVNLFCHSIPDKAYGTLDRYVNLTLKFKKLVETSFRTEKRPSQYALRLNVSRVYLNEAVKATTGMSIGKYIRSHIVLCAKRMLAHTTRNINEISDALGFEDVSYFQRIFKQETGISATEFRKNIV